MTTPALGTRTRHKLSEAKFFLDQMKSTYGHAKKFDYYLSAFISSSRSVLWVMNSEYTHEEGYEAWHRQKELSEEETKLFDKIKKIRNRTEKVGSVTTSPTYRIKVSKKDLQRLKGHTFIGLGGPASNCQIEFKSPTGERVVCTAMSVSINRNLDDFPDNHVVEVCTDYYNVLKKIVDECSRQFKR